MHAHDYVLGNRRRQIRGIDMYSFRSITFSSKETDVLSSLFTEEQDQLLYILYLDANWNRNGSSSLLVRFVSPLNQNKSIESSGTLELDDISYECARENVSKNNMESRIHLEKATREGSILFALEGNLLPKFVKLYIRTSAPYLFSLF